MVLSFGMLNATYWLIAADALESAAVHERHSLSMRRFRFSDYFGNQK